MYLQNTNGLMSHCLPFLNKYRKDSMDVAKVGFEVARTCWDLSATYRSAVRNLRKNLKTLHSTKDTLNVRLQDVQREVEMAERQHMIRTREVNHWLETTEQCMKEVSEVLEKERGLMANGCVGGYCQMNCYSRYELAELVEEKQATLIEKLHQGSSLQEVAYRPEDSMDELPLEPTVGLEAVLDRVWKFVEDKGVQSIGIYGMGGIGKTTLLKKIHNKFLKLDHYDLVAWIVVSRPTNPEKVQEDLWPKLQLPQAEWNSTNKERRTSTINKCLRKMNFLLFLDDVWDYINLFNLGIPCYQKGSKIIVSTRSVEICRTMKIHKTIKMEPLPQDQALKLFREEVGEETWKAHWEIPELAERIVSNMTHVPLAIKIVGRGMAARRTLDEWQNTVQDLKRSPSDFPGMEQEVFATLKFSYDTLPYTERRCFLYCSLFPEDYAMSREDLIDLWVGEGFLEKYDNMHEARCGGRCIIENLLHSCLLEPGAVEVDGSNTVKMHDIVRDLALWIPSQEDGLKNKKFVVEQSIKTIESAAYKRWEEAEKISVWKWDRRNEKPTRGTIFSGVTTLIMRASQIEEFPECFVESMPFLRVLDLSENDLLVKLPSNFGQLTNLEYLNLERNSTELPLQAKNFTKLRVLLIGDHCMRSTEVISSLSSLRVFSYTPEGRRNQLNIEIYEASLLEELQHLKKINDIRLSLKGSLSVMLILNSQELQGCLSSFHVRGDLQNDIRLISLASMKHMTNLESLRLDCCEFIPCDSSGLQKKIIFPNLQMVKLAFDPKIRHVSVLIYHAPRLRRLDILSCSSLEEVVRDDYFKDIEIKALKSLTHLVLCYLPKLKRICRSGLSFDSLETVEVVGCPELMQLPFKSRCGGEGGGGEPTCVDHAPCLGEITSEKQWWDSLEWEDKYTKALLSPLLNNDVDGAVERLKLAW